LLLEKYIYMKECERILLPDPYQNTSLLDLIKIDFSFDAI